MVKLQKYHWQELPQVLFLSRQIRVCRYETRLLWRQNVCRDNVFLSRQIFVLISLLFSQQTCVCRDKSMLAATKIILVSAPASDIEKGILTLPRGRIKRNREDTHCWEQTPIIQNRTRQACSVIRPQSCIQNQTTTQWPSLRFRHPSLSSFFTSQRQHILKQQCAC